MNKVLIYGCYNSENLGDDLMMIGINNKLNSSGIKPYYIENTCNKNYFNNNIQNYFKIPLFSIQKNFFERIINIIKWYFFDKEDCCDFSALILMGGGYTTDAFGIKNLIKIYLLCKKFKKTKKNIYITGQTVGPCQSKFAEKLVNKIYKLGTLIYTREEYSQKYLARNNIQSKLVGDDAYLNYKKFKLKKKDILIINYKNYKNNKNFKKEYFNFIKKFINNNQFEQILIIPFKSNSNSETYKENYELYNFLIDNNINAVFTIEKNVDDLLKTFCQSKFVISSAYHAIVLGLMYENDVISFYSDKYYEFKIKGILNWYKAKDTNAFEFNQINNTELKKNYSILNKQEITDELFKNVNESWDYIIKKIKGINKNGKI